MKHLELEEFIEFAKQEYGQNIFLDVNAEADTFEKIFDADFMDQKGFVLEYEDKISYYVNNSMSVSCDQSCSFSDEFISTDDLDFAA